MVRDGEVDPVGAVLGAQQEQLVARLHEARQVAQLDLQVGDVGDQTRRRGRDVVQPTKAASERRPMPKVQCGEILGISRSSAQNAGPNLQSSQITQDLLALLVHAERVLVAFHRLVVVPVLLVHQPACRGACDSKGTVFAPEAECRWRKMTAVQMANRRWGVDVRSQA